MPQRWVLPKLDQVDIKVEDINLKSEEDNEELIQTQNEMFDMNRESDATSILQAIQSEIRPSHFDLKDNHRKIGYLFVFDVVEGENRLVWCSGYITDISNGIDLEEYIWKQDKTKKLKIYPRGLVSKVNWDAVSGHEEKLSIVIFIPGK